MHSVKKGVKKSASFRRLAPCSTALITVTLLSACSHVVLIKSIPPGASVTINGEPKGVTPLQFEEATGSGEDYEIRLDLAGYETELIHLQQDQWWRSCVAVSLCLTPVTLGGSALGLLFARSLKDEYSFLLVADAEGKRGIGPASSQPVEAVESDAPTESELDLPAADDWPQ